MSVVSYLKSDPAPISRCRLISGQSAGYPIRLLRVQELPSAEAATQVAKAYAGHNSVSEDEILVEVINDGKQIIVFSNREVEFTFARVLGFNSTTVNANATEIGRASCWERV